MRRPRSIRLIFTDRMRRFILRLADRTGALEGLYVDVARRLPTVERFIADAQKVFDSMAKMPGRMESLEEWRQCVDSERREFREKIKALELGAKLLNATPIERHAELARRVAKLERPPITWPAETVRAATSDATPHRPHACGVCNRCGTNVGPERLMCSRCGAEEWTPPAPKSVLLYCWKCRTLRHLPPGSSCATCREILRQPMKGDTVRFDCAPAGPGSVFPSPVYHRIAYVSPEGPSITYTD